MAKGDSRASLQQRIVTNEVDAVRVGEAMRLLPAILLRHDARVQAAYQAWSARAAAYEDAGRITEADGWQLLLAWSIELNALVRVLGLSVYQSWLPKMLLCEFHRELEGAPRVAVRVPKGLQWELRIPQPKTRAGAMGGTRLEHIEQHIEAFYFCEVADPPQTKKRYAIEQGRDRRDVQKSIERARVLFGCIDAPIPQFLPGT